MVHINPYPLGEEQLRKYCAFLENQALTHQTIKFYLAIVRPKQITLGLANPSISSIARLEQLLRRVKIAKAKITQWDRSCLPITPPILAKLKEVWCCSCSLMAVCYGQQLQYMFLWILPSWQSCCNKQLVWVKFLSNAFKKKKLREE